jgi:tetratricopeptide (TPR) repeat protein
MNNDAGPAEIIARSERGGIAAMSSRELFDYADALREVGRKKDALKRYEELESLPVPAGKRWLLYLFKGQTLSDMGRFAEAEQLFRSACELDSSTVPRVYLASSLAAQERFAEAAEVLKMALDCEGDRDEVLLNLALNQRTLGQLEEAKISLERALDLTPEYTDAYDVLKDIRAALAVPPSLAAPSRPPDPRKSA